ncbi:MAG: Ig-like domain repeat protein [Blastocatellales bacterium]
MLHTHTRTRLSSLIKTFNSAQIQKKFPARKFLAVALLLLAGVAAASTIAVNAHSAGSAARWIKPLVNWAPVFFEAPARPELRAKTAPAPFFFDGPTTFSNSASIAIPGSGTGPAAASPYPSNINVAGMSGTITNVTVTLNNLSHTSSGDIDVLLVSPTGAKFMIMSDAGGTLGPASNATITLSDSAGSSLPASGGLASGTFKPTDHDPIADGNMPSPAPVAPYNDPAPAGSGTFASVFNGANPNGTWSLYAQDDSSGDSGSLAGGWSITITTLSLTATTTSVTSSLNPSFTGDSVTFTAMVSETSGGAPVTTGTVTFKEGATTLAASVPLNAMGKAAFTTSALTEGLHTITATYNPSGSFATSNGSVAQEVNNQTMVSGNTFCNTGAITISDTALPPTAATPYPSKIFVSGIPGLITKVTLSLENLTHTNPDDVDILLVGPGGQKFVVMSDAGGGTDVTNRDLVFDDAAASALPDTGGFSSGTYKPTNHVTGDSFPAPAPAGPYNEPAPAGAATFASVFNGISPTGTWSLYVIDDAAGESGSISGGWCLTFTTAGGSATTTMVTSSLNPSFTGQSVTFTAMVTDNSNSNPVTSSTVTFKEGSTTLAANVPLDAMGKATFTTSSLTEGVHIITAMYNGDINFGASSGSVSQEVNNQTMVNGNSFCNPGAITINDSGSPPTAGTPYPSKIFVSNVAGTITKVTLTLNGLTHTNPDDVEMLLVGPGGQKFIPMSDSGASDDESNLTITLDDAAGSALPDGSGLSSGTFRPADHGATSDSFPSPAPSSPYNSPAPTGAATFASVFNGISPNGTWSLYVVDDGSGESGSIANGWCLNFTTQCPTITGTVSGGGTICAGGSATVSVNVSGGTGPYTVKLSDGSMQTGAGPTFNFMVSPTMTTIYSVAAGSVGPNLCPITGSGTATVTVNQQPTTANAGTDQMLCSTAPATLAANTPMSGTGAWSIVSGPSMLLSQFSSTSSPTATFTPAGGAGAYVLQWTISNSPCTASSDQVSIVFSAPPTIANAGTDQTLCTTSTSATLAANTATSGTGAWSIVSGPSMLLSQFNSTSSPAATFTPAGGQGTYVLQWTISNSPCTASTDMVSIVFNDPPTTANAGTDQTLCTTSPATLAANTATSGTGAWSIVSGPSMSLSQFDSTSSPTATFTPAGGQGTYILKWTISNSPCTASSDNVSLVYSTPPTTANAGTDQTLCTTTTSTTLAANTATSGTGAWSVVSGPSMLLSQFNSTSSPTATFTPAGGAGAYVLQWTISNSPCTASTDQVSIVFNDPPTTANAGTDQTLCTTSPATLAANSASSGTGAWSIVSGPSMSLSQFDSTSSPTATFTPAGGQGTYILKWTISNAPCTASSDNVSLVYSTPPTTANAGTDQTLCTTSPATLAANSATSGTGAWSIVSGPSTLLSQFDSTSSPTATFTPAGGQGTYVLKWTISNSPCAASSDNVSLIYNAAPTTATVGPNQLINPLGTTAGLGGNTPSSGTGTWTIQSGGAGNFNPDANTPNATFTHTSGAGAIVLRWTIANAPCTASFAELTINVGLPPVITKAFGSPDIFLNQTTPMTITIQNPNASLALTGVAFTDAFPAGLIVATPSGLSNTCGGTVTATAGSSAVNLSSGSIAANTTCQIKVNIKGTTVGSKTNTTSNVTSKEAGPGNKATAPITVHQGNVTITDPAVCLGPGGVVAVTASVTNKSGSSKNVVFTAKLPPQLLALPGTCTANIGTCSVVNDSTVTWSGTLNNNQTLTINYQAQVADNAQSGAKLCIDTEVSFNQGAPAKITACTTVTCAAVGPGLPYPAKSEVSDQKGGSVLIYNIYTSSVGSANGQNTRINLTNIDPSRSATVHLYFVDGSNCSVADSYLCLTPNQTTSFLTSDVDPGTTGYLVVVAVDSKGCPINFNNLVGDEYVKFSSGHAANLGAEAIAAIPGGLPRCDSNTVTAQLNFDGVSYNRLPRAVALDNIPSRADGNDTMLILNRIGGHLATGAATLSSIFGIFYDDAERGVSFSFNPGVCQLRSSITNSFPRIAPRFETLVPPGRSGWLKLYSTNDQGILGAVINFNQNSEGTAGAFSQGHNLHKLTLTPSASYTIPIFPPSC